MTKHTPIFASLTPLINKEYTDDMRGDTWEIYEPFRFVYQELMYEIPKGFIYDLTSIPQWARAIIPVVGRQNRAAAAHDYAYAYHKMKQIGVLAPGVITEMLTTNKEGVLVGTIFDNMIVLFDEPRYVEVDKSWSDIMFLDVQRDCGVGWTKRNIMYNSVRFGGHSSWNKQTALGLE